MANFYLSNSPENLDAKLAQYNRTATVEAEYGDTVVSGSEYTLAHHGPRAGQPAPCLHQNINPNLIDAVGLSHLDLDALGGCMALINMKPNVPEFWDLAAFVDINGPHKLGQSGAGAETIRQLYAFWAYSQAHRVFAPRDGSVENITNTVLEYSNTVIAILSNNPELLAAGDAFAAAEKTLNEESYKGASKYVLMRKHDSFVNHLYATPEGGLGKAVVAYNTKTLSITVSLAESIPGVSACAIVQELWGPEAGGHSGIAGSPRGMEIPIADHLRCADRVQTAIQAALAK